PPALRPHRRRSGALPGPGLGGGGGRPVAPDRRGLPPVQPDHPLGPGGPGAGEGAAAAGRPKPRLPGDGLSLWSAHRQQHTSEEYSVLSPETKKLGVLQKNASGKIRFSANTTSSAIGADQEKEGERMKKKLAIFLTAAAMVLSLAACGNQDNKNNGAANNGTTNNGTNNHGTTNNGT